MSWPQVALGEVATIDRQSIDPASLVDATAYVGLEHISKGGTSIEFQQVARGELASSKFVFDEGHVLFGKLRPNLGKVARPLRSGICSTDILPIKPHEKLSRDFLLHFLQWGRTTDWATTNASGANLPRLSPRVLETLPIPLPPLEEQRRIAAILDKADALRRKRREALALLDTLTQSIFVEMFGDLSTFKSRSFSSLLLRPLRNGLSPSKAGSVVAPVLTLSALTTGTFKYDAAKEGTFKVVPPSDQCVTEGDFLICRGNGNKKLVGVGVFADRSLPDTAFPDTVIAGQIDDSVINPHYLAYIWNSGVIRSQIEASARTTNGTFKVNQAGLGSIQVPIPPLDRQTTFSDRIDKISRFRSYRTQQSSGMNDLFASLQSRAFNGTL